MADFSDIRRVESADGTRSWVEPRHNPEWDGLTNLEWLAALMSYDCDGLYVKVTQYGKGRAAYYGIGVGSSSTAPFNYTEAYNYLCGVGVGYREGRKK